MLSRASPLPFIRSLAVPLSLLLPLARPPPRLLCARRPLSLSRRVPMAAPAPEPTVSATSGKPDPLPHTASTTPAAMAGEMVPSLSTNSCWHTDAGSRSSFYPVLRGDDPTIWDAVVVGGGIVGVSTAWELGKAGLKVALVEGRSLGTGTTGWSTAKLTAQQNLLYTQLASMHGKETARLYGEMNMQAIAAVEQQNKELGLDCAFQRVAHATWTSVDKQEPNVRKEAELCVELGLPARYLTGAEVAQDLPASIEPKGAVLFENQAAFNPVKYCFNLTAQFAKLPGCVVFEHTRCVEVASVSAPHKVVCETGSLQAKHVVLATHLPILDRSGHFSLFSPSRTVCIAVRLTDESKLPKQMWISDSTTPMRSMRVGDQRELIIAGESFEQGSVTDTNEKYKILEEWAREHFPVKEVSHRWSSMDFMSSTHMPYVGYLQRGCHSLYTATAMSKWGLANGVAAAAIIRDLVTQGESALESNRYAKMLDACRWDLVKAGPGALQENMHTMKHFVGDKIKAALASDISKLKRGEGGLCKVNGESVGAYLDGEGKYHLVKPICTHLGCNVVFNQGEKCWDCPCHGSQFTVDGDVIQGPACKKLPSMNHLQW